VCTVANPNTPHQVVLGQECAHFHIGAVFERPPLLSTAWHVNCREQ
jgi:hypothetical protein